ncbi:mucin-2-like isoform X2 [Macrobrachium nipponense]|uniref:mucin-2-like isoform X2 n=1 Tax=Macrobrachium nipponense TaxID=159736 RepID=UPI0030C86F8F
MDDDGQKQRLLDVIGDPHALETFLETLPSSGLDSPRFDNVTPSTDPGLINSCLDNLVFDGQFLGQVRGGSHPLSHPHVLQQVLPSSSLPAAPQGASHPQQQQPQSQQQHQQHQHQQQQQQHQHPHTHHQQNVALPSPGAPQVGGAPSSSGGEGSRENEHPTLQQLFGSSTTFSPQQHSQPQVQPQTSLHQQNAGTVGHSLSPAILTTTASRLPSIQQASHLQQQLSVHPTPRSVAVRSQISPATKNATSGPPTVPQPTPQVLPQAAAAPAPTQVMPSSVQLVGGPSQVITSGGQIITSAAPQLLQGTQLLQGPGSTQVMPTGQLLPGQVLHNGPLIQGGQVLHGAHMLPGGQLLPSGQVIQGGQVLSGGQLIQSGSVINSSQLITTTSQMVTSGLSTAPTPSYVTPSTLTVQQQQQQQQQQQPQQQQQSQTPVTLHQSGQSPASAVSPFSVPTKSPGTALPRTSPSPSPYHPTTPSPHPSVQSPAPYTTRSPAPSPHTSVGTMKSPAPPTPSPAATPTPQTHTNIAAAIPQQQTTGMVQSVMGNGGMVQGLVPQLPLSQVMGSNGMVLPQTTVQQQAAAGVKQVVSGGQIIQIVSSPQPTQQRQSLSTPAHKPIQPKQPQLLPKPPQSVSSGQPPPPPPPGKSIISTRSVTPGGQQPIVIGAAGQPTATMMTSQQGIGGFVINPSPLQSGLQQPILIQQPNGVLLVRPSGPGGAAGAPAQAFLVPMPGQPQIVSAGAKGGQPQTVVFPTSGQGGPAFVIPQNAASSLGASGVMGAAQGARGHQPIIRLVAPQAPLQLQQIPTPNGPTLVALPTGQVNLSGLLAAGGATMRTLAPQVASGPLQLAPSSVAPPNMAPVAASMGHLHMAGTGQQLQVSVPGAPLQLATSLPSSLPSVITTTKQTVIDESVAPPPAPPPAPPVVSCSEAGPHNQTLNDSNKAVKKKPKKKKKEKDPKDEKLKSKGGSINLNDILKETGIMGDMMLFDDNELGLGGDGMEVGQISVSTSVKTATPVVTLVTTAQAAGSITETVTAGTVGIHDNTNHVVLGTHQPMLVGMNNPVPQGTVVISSAQTGLPTATTMPSGMCLTLDPSGKVILGADPSKTHIAASSVPTPSPVGGLVIPSNQPQVQVISSGAVGVVSTSTVAGVTSSGTVVNVMNNSMPTIMSGSNGHIGPGILPTVGSLPSFTQLLTPPTQVTTNVTVQGPTITTRSVPVQLQSPPTAKVTQVMAKTQTGADISRVAQNTHLLQALHLPASEKTTIASGPPILTSITSGQQAVATSTREPTSVPMQVSVGDGGSMVAVVSVGSVMSRPSENVVSTGTTFSSPAPLSILVASQASQVPPSPAVIASSSATNSVVSGAIISHKPFVTNSALTPQTNVTYTNSENVPITRGHPQIASALHHDNVPSHINSNSGVFAIKNSESGSKPPSYQNEYVATLQRSQNLIEASKNKSKSNKKRKKDKEVETVPTASSSPVIIKQSLHDRLKASGTSSASGIIQQNLSSLPNGLSNPNLKNTCHNSGLSHYPSVTIPASVCDGVSNSDTTPVVGSSMPTVSMSTVLPSLTTTATASVQTPPINTTTSSTLTTTSHTHTGVVIPGQKQQVKQVKTLILSPQNKEALKKVHNQIQAIQHKKSDQDSAQLQQLYSEYRKIMATGKHYTVTTSPQQSQISQPPSQPTPVRYSHPVGHKIITLTQFKQHIKHLQQDQQRQVIDPSKPVLQRWKETPTTTSTAAGTTVTQVTTTPHVSPTSQNSTAVTVSRPSISPVSSASMPIITTSAPSPTVPTTSTTVTACITSSTYNCTTKMAPPQCSPVSSTSSSTFPNSSGPSPKSSAPSGNILPSQTSPRYVSSGVNQEHSSNQAEPQQLPYVTKDQLFEHQLRTDQNGAVNPEYRTPFKNKIDACKRLIRYHVFSDKGPTQKDLIESDNQFEIQAESLLKKFSNMKYKYQSLLLKDSMRRHASSEYVMLYRLFVQEDKSSIERDKIDVQNSKVLDLPPAPAHWLTGETPPTDPPYPWESEWENQKVYICDSMDEEEEEDQTQQTSNTVVTDINELSGENKLKVEEENEDFDGSQEGDPQLEIFMDEEEEEEAVEEEEDADKEIKINVKNEGERQSPSEINSKSTVYAIDMHNNNSASDTNNSAKAEGKSIKAESDLKQDGEGEQKLVICDNDVTNVCSVSPLPKLGVNESEHPYDSWTSNRENDNRFSEGSNSPVPNNAPSDGSKVSSPSYEKITNESYRDAHSPSLNIVSSDRPERDKRKEKCDKDKDRRKSDKVKDKERVRDREKEDRPPKKLKIKLKHDDRAVVPPLRIRTEERGSCLKLTLKKQEGSEAYYSVGEERKREYRVEQHDDEEEEDCAENVPEKQFDRDEGEDECEAEGSHDLKEVKVVLQDVLKDKKFKLKKHEEERTTKRKRRERSDDRNDRSDRRNRNNYHWSNHAQDIYQAEGERNSSQQSNYDGRTWNHNSNAEWTRSGASVDWRRTSNNDGGDWQRTSGESGPVGEWNRGSSEGASSVSHSSDNRSSRDYSPHPHLLHYNEHYDAREFSNRQNHSQSYGHSGSQSRNTHNYH